jgi:ribosome-binding protein aMBF1 (putative translation factor)
MLELKCNICRKSIKGEELVKQFSVQKTLVHFCESCYNILFIGIENETEYLVSLLTCVLQDKVREGK